MAIILIILYLPLVAVLGYLVMRQGWPGAYKAAALAALLLALPVYMMLMWTTETREVFLFGLGLVFVTIIPANCIALAIGGGVAWLRNRRG